MAQELNIHLETDSSTPLDRQIYEYIRGEIRNGSLAADERLPSTRALASYLQVARSTTELAYSQLLSEGYIRSRRNSGYFVNEIENFPDLRLEDYYQRQEAHVENRVHQRSHQLHAQRPDDDADDEQDDDGDENVHRRRPPDPPEEDEKDGRDHQHVQYVHGGQAQETEYLQNHSPQIYSFAG